MIKDAYPLSSIESNLHKLQGAKYFSTLDSAGAYHAVEIHPESREYTAFVTPFGQFQFVRMPFGLSNAGACYSRLVALALQYLPAEYVLAYLDDIIVFSKDKWEHVKQLKRVLEVHRHFGMKLKLSKCKVLRTEVEYLGHLVSHAGIRMVPEYVQKILEWPLPATGKQLKQFLGFIGYYRSFIPDVADLTFEMNDMKKENKLEWTPGVIEKFELLKQKFREQPLRSYPDYSSDKPFIFDTDFSKTNMADALKAQWMSMYSGRNRMPAVLNSSTEFEILSGNAQESQLVEAQIQALTEAANILGLPAYYLGAPNSSRTYANVEQENLQLVRWSIQPIAERIEQVLSDLLVRGQYARFDYDTLLRTDTNSRYAAYQTAITSGFLTVDEVS